MVLTGVAYWASVQEPNVKFEPVYRIDLAISDEDAEMIRNESKKISPKGRQISIKKDERGNVFTIKKKAYKKDGTPNMKPKVVDRSKKPFDQLIGNGSVVDVSFKLFEYTKPTKGVSTELQAIRVREHVPYNDGGVSEFEDLDDEEDTGTEEFTDDDVPF